VKEAEEEKSCLKYKKGPFEFMFPNFSLHKRFIIIRETLSGERESESAFDASAMKNDSTESLHLLTVLASEIREKLPD
jgi:hypothetical protein